MSILFFSRLVHPKFISRSLYFACGLYLTGLAVAVNAQEVGTQEVHGMELTPVIVQANQPFEVTVTGFNINTTQSLRPDRTLTRRFIRLR